MLFFFFIVIYIYFFGGGMAEDVACNVFTTLIWLPDLK